MVKQQSSSGGSGANPGAWMTAADPEQTFFEDPALDRALAMIMVLAAELAVTRDRLRSLEVLLQNAGTISAGALDSYRPEPAEEAALAVHKI